MRVAAAAIVALMSIGWGLDATANGSVTQAARQVPADQVTVLVVEGMT